MEFKDGLLFPSQSGIGSDILVDMMPCADHDTHWRGKQGHSPSIQCVLKLCIVISLLILQPDRNAFAEPSAHLQLTADIGTGLQFGSLDLSGGAPLIANRYSIATPLDGIQSRLGLALQMDRICLRLDAYLTRYGDATLTDTDWAPDGVLWAQSRSESAGNANTIDIGLDWALLDWTSLGNSEFLMELGMGYYRQALSITARNKQYTVMEYPYAAYLTDAWLVRTAEPGVFLEDEITISSFGLRVASGVRTPVGPTVVTLILSARYRAPLSATFREVRYSDRPDIAVVRGIDLDGYALYWSFSVVLSRPPGHKFAAWQIQAGYAQESLSADGTDVAWSYYSRDLENTLTLDQQVAFVELSRSF